MVKLSDEQIVPVCGIQTSTKIHTPADLMLCDTIHVLGFDDHWARYLSANDLAHDVISARLVVDTSVAACELAASENGYAIMIERFARRAIETGRPIKIVGASVAVEQSHYMIQRNTGPTEKRVSALFCKWLETCFWGRFLAGETNQNFVDEFYQQAIRSSWSISHLWLFLTFAAPHPSGCRTLFETCPTAWMRNGSVWNRTYKVIRERPAVYHLALESRFVSIDIYRQIFDEFLDGYWANLKEGAKAGDIRDSDLQIKAWMLMGITQFFGEKVTQWDTPPDNACIVEEVMSVLTHGMKP